MKIELLEITEVELADLFSAMNPQEAMELLIKTAAYINQQHDFNKNEVGNLVVSYFEYEVFVADLVIDAVLEPYAKQEETEPDADDVADYMIKRYKEDD